MAVLLSARGATEGDGHLSLENYLARMCHFDTLVLNLMFLRLRIGKSHKGWMFVFLVITCLVLKKC